MNSQAFQRNPTQAGPRRKRGKDYALALIAAILLTIPLLLITGERNEVIETRYQISELRRTNDALVIQQRRLRAERSRLSRPNRIFREGLEMGLRPIPPQRRIEVTVDPNGHDDPILIASLGEEP